MVPVWYVSVKIVFKWMWENNFKEVLWRWSSYPSQLFKRSHSRIFLQTGKPMNVYKMQD